MLTPQKRYGLLVHLCEAVNSCHDVRAFFQQVSEGIHELTGCNRVILIGVSGEHAGRHGLAMEFAEATVVFELPASILGISAAQWVLEHRQPRIVSHRDPTGALAEEQRLFGQGYQTCLYLPLICRAETIGVLGLAGRREDQLEQWDRKFLEDLSNLLALARDDLAARAHMAELLRFQQEFTYLRDEIKTDRNLRSLTGESPAMKAVRLAIQQVARTDSTALIVGETGTGKELIARAIHQLSPRRNHLLVAVNCAALAPGVIASELFGHERGAFTGATRRRIGRFELAHGGTVFLDEVGELPLETQVMLLRVLQEHTIERVGGQEPVAVDVRVIAATHQDLTAAMSQGRFRADLFFRLNVFPIRVPPLRDRPEDIPDLARHFMAHFARRMNKPVTRVNPASLQLLTDYHWPGNVRELENIMERAMIVAIGDALEVDPDWLRPAPTNRITAPVRPGLAELERRAIIDALERCNGKIYGPSGAAAVLGLKPTTLYGKMRKHGIGRRPGPN